MHREKKSIAMLAAILGILIIAIAVYVFWDKDDKDKVTEHQPQVTSLFDTPILSMETGYIDDDTLLNKIREACYPYATHLSEDTTFYTEDGIELYACFCVNNDVEIMIYVNLDTEEFKYELREISSTDAPVEGID